MRTQSKNLNFQDSFIDGKYQVLAAHSPLSRDGKVPGVPLLMS